MQTYARYDTSSRHYCHRHCPLFEFITKYDKHMTLFTCRYTIRKFITKDDTRRPSSVSCCDFLSNIME